MANTGIRTGAPGVVLGIFLGAVGVYYTFGWFVGWLLTHTTPGAVLDTWLVGVGVGGSSEVFALVCALGGIRNMLAKPGVAK